MNELPQLSVVVPVHNEEDNVAPLVAEILAALRGRIAFEIVYVDDTSRDATLHRLRELQAATPEKLPIPRLLSNDAESVPAIEEKARQIASLGATRKHARPEPAAPHIRGSKPGKPVQTAAILPTGVEAGVLR